MNTISSHLLCLLALMLCLLIESLCKREILQEADDKLKFSQLKSSAGHA